MYKIINIGIPKYLTDLIPKREIGYNIRNRNKSFFHCRTESFKNSFFPYTIEAWYSLDPSIINSNSLEVFKSKLLAFIRPVQRSIYNVFNPQGLKFLTRLRLGLSHLNEHRFRHKPTVLLQFGSGKYATFFSALPSLCNFSHGSYE